MLLELTISQLDIGYVPQGRAQVMGQLGYMQWLGALPAMSHYIDEATHAYALAKPFAANSPAVDVFCDLLLSSLKAPLSPMPLKLPARERRGGARARRSAY
ncbi:MAG: hypothetical protein AAFQ38_08285 [Pseudomonadota bacterium]